MKGKPSNAGRSGNKAASSSSSSSSPWALKARERTLQKKKDDKATVTNPFDKFANNKKKHDVLNRKVKGEDRNVGRAREKAIDERKKKLLQDYQKSKKSNVFNDKRFGESDASLSLEEKMFMRFQQDKLKKSRNNAIFNLDSQEEMLTHKGQVLGTSNLNDEDWVSSDDEGGGKLGKDVVNNLHFGGGLVEKRRSEEMAGEGEAKKTKLDALQEIVMKSKLHKLEKKEAKAEQEDEREKLDKAFASLIQSSHVEINPNWNRRGGRGMEEAVTGSKDQSADDLYDRSLYEMTNESKARPSERTKSDEEIAIETKEKIEELERARLRRMHQTDEEEEDEDLDEALDDRNPRSQRKGEKGRTDDEVDMEKAAKKSKKANAIDESSERNDDALDEEYSDSDSDDDSKNGDDSDEEEDEDGDEDKDEDGDEDEDESGEESEEENDQDLKKKKKLAKEADRVPAVSKRLKLLLEQDARSTINAGMPHKIMCPSDLQGLDDLAAQYVRSTADMAALIDRIVAWNSVHLPGPQGAQNKSKMNNFLDILIKHFIRIGDGLSDCKDASEQGGQLAQLDHLSGVIFQLTAQLEGGQALWGRTLKILQAQLMKRLRDYAIGKRTTCWPSLGRLLLMQLLGRVFSVTDLKNAVVGPTMLFLGQCLTQCPVSTCEDVASGLLVCSMLIGTFLQDTKRFMPEPLLFIHSVLVLYLPRRNTKQLVDVLPTFNKLSFSAFRSEVATQDNSDADGDEDESSLKIDWSCFAPARTDDIEESGGANPAAALSLLSTAQRLLQALSGCLYEAFEGSPELLHPVLTTLQVLKPTAAPALPASIQQSTSALIESLQGQLRTKIETRGPLQCRQHVVTSLDMKNPRFQADYTLKKDLEPDQERAKMKQLKRQLNREKKAAMRELRRDSDFIDQERYKTSREQHEERKNERVKNYGWMEDQQAGINEIVRKNAAKGGAPLFGGGSGVVKKAVVKRL